jgi:hypothetical protein
MLRLGPCVLKHRFYLQLEKFHRFLAVQLVVNQFLGYECGNAIVQGWHEDAERFFKPSN